MNRSLVALIIFLLILLTLSYLTFKKTETSCEEYCKEQPHILCVGEWNITGEYPNCNCQYVCFETTTTTTTTTIPIPQYLIILKNISSSHNWTMFEVGKERFNCADFTALAVEELRNANYITYPICGWLRHNSHAWVRIEFNESYYRDFEPQNAQDVTENPDYVFSRRCVVRGVY